MTQSRRHEDPSDAWPANLGEASLALSAGVNLLLIGSDDQIRQMVRALRPELQGPTRTWAPGGPLELPDPTDGGTLILHHVHALPPADQRRLFDWLQAASRRVRVISTTPASLVPLIKRGAFHETLHYRLNVICVELGRV